MIKTLATAAFIATASMTFVSVAQAEDFPATPLNHGPMMMGGMAVPAVNVIAPFDTVMNAVAPAPAPMADAPMMHRHHHMMRHHMHKKMMMKKAMMKKDM